MSSSGFAFSMLSLWFFHTFVRLQKLLKEAEKEEADDDDEDLEEDEDDGVNLSHA